MANQQASKDDNDVSSLLVVSSVDGTTMKVKGNPVTGAMLVDTSGGFVNPMTSTGDIIYSSDNSGTPTRRGIGTAGQVLTVSGGLPTWQTAGSGTVTSVSVVTANGVSGSVATATTTPAITLTLGAITPTTVNGLTISTTTGTFTLTNGKTFAVTNGLTLSGTDSTAMTFPTTSATIARTDAANTFTGASTASAWVLTSPTITTKLNPTSDDGAPLGDTTHNWSDLFLASGGVINYANSNVVITHTSGILTMGTGTLKITTPTNTSTSVVTIDGTQTLTNKSIVASQVTTGTFGTGAYTMDTSLAVPQVFNAENAVTASGNAITFTRANRINKVTNNSAAGITITLSTSGAVAGDMLIIKSVPSSAVAQTITWVNTENSDITASANLNASTTSPRTDGFMWNSLTSKWRCIASA